jgi:hypothetical protein
MRSHLPAILLFFAMAPTAVRAEHADIDLRVYHYDRLSKTVLARSEAHADEDPPVGGVNPRPLLRVKMGDPLVMQFFFTNTYPHSEIKDVAVRYFVVREEKAGQKKVPALDKDVFLQGRFGLNFKPKAKVGARVAFKLDKPGIYLLRVESVGTKSDHEHFAAIDIQVEE